MAGGPILPSSIYLGGASGNLSPTFYTSGAGTTTANSTIEGIGVIANLNTAADSSAVMQFNIPEILPIGVLKCRVLAWANATSGIAKLDIIDGRTPAGSNIANATFTTEAGSPTISQTWTTADIIVENKVTLTQSPTVNDIYTVVATWRASGWTLASSSVWQFSLVWE
jgi:hypothetical protein